MDHCPSEEAMVKATKRAAELWPYAQGKKLTKAAVIDLKERLGCSRATLFRAVASLRASGTVTALVPKKRGRKPLSCFLSEEHEDVIAYCVK